MVTPRSITSCRIHSVYEGPTAHDFLIVHRGHKRHPPRRPNGRLGHYPPPKLLSCDSRKEFAEKLRRRISALTTDESIVCFTDGSKRVVNGFCRVGIGFTIQHHGVEIDHNSANLGPRFEVFNAKMLALALALKSAASQARRLNSHSIILFADNQAAVSLITSLDKHPGQFASIAFREAANKFLHKAPENRIKVCWVPGHNGIEGNKRADQLANEGGSKPPVSILNRSLTWSKAQSTHQASRAWGREWASQPHSLFVTNHIRRPPSLTLARFARSYRGHRLTHARLNQIILGHGFFGEYRERFRPDDDPSCPCGQPGKLLIMSFATAIYTLRLATSSGGHSLNSLARQAPSRSTRRPMPPFPLLLFMIIYSTPMLSVSVSCIRLSLVLSLRSTAHSLGPVCTLRAQVFYLLSTALCVPLSFLSSASPVSPAWGSGSSSKSMGDTCKVFRNRLEDAVDCWAGTNTRQRGRCKYPILYVSPRLSSGSLLTLVKQETLLKETILALIDLEEYQEALDELDLYIVTMPFDQNPVLHLYAGMLWLFTAQPQAEVSIDSVSKGTSRNEILDVARWNAPRVAAAKRHFRRAIALDPGNEFARGEQPEVSSLGAMDDEDEDEEANIKEEPDITMASYKDEDDDLIALSIKMDTDSDDDDLMKQGPANDREAIFSSVVHSRRFIFA
ncbi:Reverse transcriptase (RNA-dependent DNA polymerase) [Rhizoctonia solani]|uniref:ribonuclease H n=1 Tax=Rhizoctonia solani TaxID=456999 RepID=A0A8H7M8X4_9AGAM|nr:Reverse transcriptase (RNA-dependent DNA polymerase) [Rhizoctonia solani]